MNRVEDVVRQTALFGALQPEAAARLIAHLSYERRPEGEVIYEAGESGDCLYVVVSGRVKVSRAATPDRISVLEVLGPGEVFGELSLFDRGPRTATTVALRNCELAVLAHRELHELIASDPNTGVRLLAHLAQRVRKANETIAYTLQMDLKGRVANALLELAGRFGRPHPGGLYVDHGLSQQDLALYVGATREMVNRVLADFQARGWLRVERRALLIRSRPGLERYRQPHDGVADTRNDAAVLPSRAPAYIAQSAG